jgi:hypothetical protein
MEDSKRSSTSEFLKNVVKANKSDHVTIDELKISMHERGFGILLIAFSLPLAVPLPYIPGVTTIFAIPLFFLSVQMILGFDSPWLPKWLTRLSVKRRILSFIVIKSSPLLKKIERLLKPRLLFFSSHEGTKIIGFFALIFTISIALPLPFTNFVPAIAILTLALGMLSRDGVTIFIGILIGCAGVLFTVAVIILGKKIAISIINSLIYIF